MLSCPSLMQQETGTLTSLFGGNAADIPIITKSSILFMVGIHLLVHRGTRRDDWIVAYALHIQSVIHGKQWHRLVTHTLLHANLSHLVFNMLSFFSFGSSLEKRIGTIQYAATLVVGTVLSPAIYILLTLLVSWIWKREDLYTLCVGFSAVIYHIAVVEYATKRTNLASMQDIAVKIAPTLVLDSRDSRASFVGHLSGVFSGAIQVLFMKLWKESRSVARKILSSS